MKTCALCDKGSTMGGTRAFLRSHYNPTSRIRKYPNLQWAKLPGIAKGAGGNAASSTRAKVCVRCMKKLHG